MHDLEMFKQYLKDKSMPKRKKHDFLNKYKDQLQGGAAPRMKGVKLAKHVVQHGGSWSSFTNWVRGAVNTVGNAAKKVGNVVYDKAIVPAYKQLKEKPLSTLGKVAGVVSMVPGPHSAALKAAATGLSSVGAATGYGQQGGAVSDGNKVLMVF